jgi:hypothetical protein
MTIYTVLAPLSRDGEAAPAAAADPMRVVLVKEGVAWPALFFGAIWLIYRRMWLVLAGYVIVSVLAGYAAERLGGDLPGIFMLLAHVLFAIEGNELRRWTLRRQGYGLTAVVEGRNIEEAEIRYFAALEDAAPEVPAVPPAPPMPAMRAAILRPVTPSAEAGDVVGLFPTPQGGRGP